MVKILVVEDERKIRELLEDTLKAKGFTPIPCKNGQEALDQFQTEVPDLVLTDIMLPRIDGFTLIEKIRESAQGKDVPVIAMSAVYKDVEIQENLMSKHNVDFLLKPFSVVNLLSKIQSVCPSIEPTETVTESQTQPSVQSGEIEHFSVPLLFVNFFSEGKPECLF